MSREFCVIGNLNAHLVLCPLRDFPIWGSELIANHIFSTFVVGLPYSL